MNIIIFIKICASYFKLHGKILIPISLYYASRCFQTLFALPAQLSMMNLGMMFGFPAILTPALLSATGDELKADKHTASWLGELRKLTSRFQYKIQSRATVSSSRATFV